MAWAGAMASAGVTATVGIGSTGGHSLETLALVTLAALLAPTVALALAAHRLRPASTTKIVTVGAALGVFAAEIAGMATFFGAITVDALIPEWSLTRAFVGGVGSSASLATALLTAAIAPLEEAAKIALAVGVAWRARDVEGRTGAALALIAVAAGFAFTENLGYLSQGDPWAMLGPRSSAAWMHLTLAVFCAWLLFMRGFPSWRRILAVWLFASFAHGSWNLTSELGRWLIGNDEMIGFVFTPLLTVGVAFALPPALDGLSKALRAHPPQRAWALAFAGVAAALAVAFAPLPAALMGDAGVQFSIALYLKVGAGAAFLAAAWTAVAPPRHWGGVPGGQSLEKIW